MADKPNILVLCSGNSCRSQIAEGYFRHFASDRFNVYSAGTEPKDRIHPVAIQVMAEDGIDLAGQSPKGLKGILGRLPVRFLIIVCSGAHESCPVTFPGILRRLFWPFDDPAVFEGSPTEVLNEFRRVRDEIKKRILAWLESEESL